MLTLTIFGLDKTKQVVNVSNKVLLDQKGNKLHPSKVAKNMAEAAQTIAGHNYYQHSFSN